MTFLQQIQTWDWSKAFEVAGEQNERNDNSPDIREALLGSGVSLNPFTRKDIKEIAALIDGEHDSTNNWECVGRLKDGRWFYLSAGCDYTGWDCHSGGYVIVAKTQKQLLKYGMSNEERERLGVGYSMEM